MESPGQWLTTFPDLPAEAFVDEVRARRPRAAGRLTPAAWRDLRAGYTAQLAAVGALPAEAAGLERRVADLVVAAYGLGPDAVALLAATAPPRTPGMGSSNGGA